MKENKYLDRLSLSPVSKNYYARAKRDSRQSSIFFETPDHLTVYGGDKLLAKTPVSDDVAADRSTTSTLDIFNGHDACFRPRSHI
jgi:hypothetical protein